MADVKIIIKAKDEASAAIQNVDRSARGMLGGLGSLAKSVAGPLAGLFAAKKMFDFAAGSLAAADAADMIATKYRTVFAGVTDAADQAASAFAARFRLAESTAKQLLGNTADLLTGLGMDAASALDLSGQANALAADLANFNNLQGGATRASEILTQAMLGETGAMTALGVKINAAMIAQRAQEMAAKGQTFATQEQAKAAATLSLAMEQSKNAIAAHDATMASGQATRAALAESWTALKEQVGSLLRELTGSPAVLQSLISGIQTVTTFIRDNFQTIQYTAAATWLDIRYGAEMVWDILRSVFTRAPELVSAAGTDMVSIAEWIGDNWRTIFANIAEYALTALINVGQNVRNTFTAVWDYVKSGFTSWQTPEIAGLLDGARPATLDGPALASTGILADIWADTGDTRSRKAAALAQLEADIFTTAKNASDATIAAVTQPATAAAKMVADTAGLAMRNTADEYTAIMAARSITGARASALAPISAAVPVSATASNGTPVGGGTQDRIAAGVQRMVASLDAIRRHLEAQPVLGVV